MAARPSIPAVLAGRSSWHRTHCAASRLTATVRGPRRIWHGQHCLQITKSLRVQWNHRQESLLDGSGIESRWGGHIFRTRPDRPWGPPSLLCNGYRVFLGVKRLGRGVVYPPPSSAEVKEREELYICSPSGSLWPILGRTLFYKILVKAALKCDVKTWAWGDGDKTEATQMRT